MSDFCDLDLECGQSCTSHQPTSDIWHCLHVLPTFLASILGLKILKMILFSYSTIHSFLCCLWLTELIYSVNRRTFRECSIFWPTNTLLSYNGASLGRFQGFRESNSDGILWLSVIVYRSVFRHTLYCKADAVNLLSYISTVFITVVTVSWEIKQLWELFMNSHSFTCLQTKLRFY